SRRNLRVRRALNVGSTAAPSHERASALSCRSSGIESAVTRRRGARAVTATVDVLSDVLRAIRLTGAVYFDVEVSSPWVADTPPSRDIAGAVMPGAQRVIAYHLVPRRWCSGY